MDKLENLENLDNLNISQGDINEIKNELNTGFTIDNKTIKNAIRYKNELHCPIISSLNSEASNVCGPSGTGVNIAKCIQSNDIQTCSPNNKVDKYCGQADYHIYCIDDDGNSISYEGKSYKEGKCSMYKWENNNCYKFDDS